MSQTPQNVRAACAFFRRCLNIFKINNYCEHMRRREAPLENFLAFMFPFSASLFILKAILVICDPDNHRETQRLS